MLRRFRYFIALGFIALAGCVSPSIAEFNALGLLSAGYTLRQSGYPRPAIPFYTATIFYSPGSWMIYEARGLAYATIGQHDAAISNFDQTLKINPKGHFAMLLRGVAKSEKGSFAEALSDLNAAVEMTRKTPYHPFYLLYLAKTQIAAGQLWSGILALNDVMAADIEDLNDLAFELRADAIIKLQQSQKFKSIANASTVFGCNVLLLHTCELKARIMNVRLQREHDGFSATSSRAPQSSAELCAEIERHFGAAVRKVRMASNSRKPWSR